MEGKKYTYGEQEMMEEGIERDLQKLSASTRVLVDVKKIINFEFQ